MSDPVECGDCGREHLSISAMMQCPCYKITKHGYPVDDDLVHPFTD